MLANKSKSTDKTQLIRVEITISSLLDRTHW